MYKDGDLIGIPIQVIIGEKNAKKNIVEIKIRKDRAVVEVKTSEVETAIKDILRRIGG